MSLRKTDKDLGTIVVRVGLYKYGVDMQNMGQHGKEYEIRSTDLAAEVTGVYKQFAGKTILNSLDFKLPMGKIYGICGRNGAGKSVFLRTLVGLILPDGGEVRVFNQRIGKDVEFPDSTGALIDHPGFLLAESGYRNLELLAKISGEASEDDIRLAMAFVGLDPDDKKPVRTYSVGMRQRLGLAQAIMEKPNLIILDEPTAALDFEGQREMYDYLKDLKRQGKTILITSHSLHEVEILCDKAYLLESGRLAPMEEVNGAKG